MLRCVLEQDSTREEATLSTELVMSFDCTSCERSTHRHVVSRAMYMLHMPMLLARESNMWLTIYSALYVYVPLYTVSYMQDKNVVMYQH